MNIFKSKLFYIFCALCIAAVIGTFFLYSTNEGVATEFRQIRQPKPNRFYIGIDVSATINPDTLDDFRNNVIARLKNFIGDEAVFYQIDSFGNPGCDSRSVNHVISKQSPKDETAFKWDVEDKIRRISIAQIPEQGKSIGKPLTTPLHYLLRNEVLPKWSGGRVIIFSDLMNDDSDCLRQYPFPEEAIKKFGENTEGQIVFIYPTPHTINNPEVDKANIKKQQEFIAKMERMRSQGKVRAFFYHIPDDPKKQSNFMKSQLQNAIPTTTFEIIIERVARVFDTMVSAVRG